MKNRDVFEVLLKELNQLRVQLDGGSNDVAKQGFNRVLGQLRVLAKRQRISEDQWMSLYHLEFLEIGR